MSTSRRRRHDGIVASIVAVALMAGSLRCRPASAATPVDYPAASVVGNRSSSDAAAAAATGRSDADRARMPLRPSLARAVTAFLPFVRAAERRPESRCSRHTDIYMGQLDDFKLWATQSKRLHVLRESSPAGEGGGGVLRRKGVKTSSGATSSEPDKSQGLQGPCASSDTGSLLATATKRWLPNRTGGLPINGRRQEMTTPLLTERSNTVPQ